MIKLDKFDIISNNHILINPFKDGWDNISTTNCYAYALGLDIGYDKLLIDEYEPGFTFHSKLSLYFNENELLNNVVKDLDNLEIDFRHVNDYYKLNKGEWRIAIFGGHRLSDDKFDDYHFMRQTCDGIWVHKKGYFGKPMKVQKRITSSYIEDDILYNHLITLCLKRSVNYSKSI